MNEYKMKNKFISLENIMRFHPDGIDRKVFFNIEVLISKDIALTNKIILELIVETKQQEYKLLDRVINFHEDRIIFENSHEDPTVAIGNNFCFAMTIERSMLKQKIKELCIEEKDILSIGGRAYINENGERLLILSDKINDIPWAHIWSDYLFTSFVDDYKIKSKKNASLTFHLTDKDGKYSEQTRDVLKNDIIDFEFFVKNYVYVGVQFSIYNAYKDIDLDIEEKYVVKGQKGMYQSDVLKIENNTYYPNIVFHEKFLNKIDKEQEKFIEINNITKLIEYYENNPKNIRYFEMSVDFLIKTYKEKRTYAQSKIYSSNKESKYFHIDNEVCKTCKVNSICIQNVPSNLSEQLKKKVVIMENSSNCRLNNIFNKINDEK